LVYKDYDILTPEQRLAFETNPTPQRNRGISVAESELQLVRYNFIYDGKQQHTYLYLPYMHNDAIIINGKRHAIQRGIVEQVFSRTNDGISMRITRAPLRFTRTTIFKMVSAVTGEFVNEFVIGTSGLHLKKRRAKPGIELTIIHYLLCRFDFVSTLARFRLSPEDVQFVKYIGTDTEDFEYYLAKKPSKLNDVYLRVRKSVLEDGTARKFIANLLYVLSHFSRHAVEDLYDQSCSVWRVMLGKIIHGDVSDAQALNNINSHLFSFDIYLDLDTQIRLNRFGVKVNGIYELLTYIFVNIDRIMVRTTHQDLYTKRIDVAEGVLVKAVVQRIWQRFYRFEKQAARMQEKDVRSMLAISPMQISRIYASDNIITSPAVYGDNWAIAYGMTAMQMTGSRKANPQAPESRFHPSIAVVKTLISFSGQNPGATGSINPFLEITPDGGIVRPDYADTIDPMVKFLPFQ
jgi:hypothetical protein